MRSVVARSPHFRIRGKLQRWELPGLPRVIADRFERNLARLRYLVPPRVVAAVFSTAWNRWCTARRFQQRHRIWNFCKLGCGGSAEDSIEHYARCHIARQFHGNMLRIRDSWLLPWWIGVQDSHAEDSCLILGSLGAYAMYRTINAPRARGGVSREEAIPALRQALHEAASGHAKAERALAMVWVRSECPVSR